MPAGFIDATGLPQSPLDAAADFSARIVPSIRETIAAGGDAVVLFAPADHTHNGWQLAAIQNLAREAAPCRINAVAGISAEDPNSSQAMQFLRDAPGLTGQLLQVDGNFAQSD